MHVFVYFVYFSMILRGCSCLVDTPVFVIDDGILKDQERHRVNPFLETPAEEFLRLCRELQARSTTVVLFVETLLSAEDVSTKDAKGTPFTHLRQSFRERKLLYLPGVRDAYGALRGQFPSLDFNTFHLRSTTTKLRLDDTFHFLYIFFEDGTNETRVEMLRRHDMMIVSVIFAVRQFAKGPVTAFYTGKRNPVRARGEEAADDSAAPERAAPAQWRTQRCDNDTFDFYDAKLANGREAQLVPAGCIRMDAKEFVAYEILFHSYSKNARGNSYRLKLTFAPYPTKWTWTEAVLMTDGFDTLSVVPMNVSHAWDRTYSSDASLAMTPLEWFHPKLSISNFKITLYSPTGGAGAGDPYMRAGPATTTRARAPTSPAVDDPKKHLREEPPPPVTDPEGNPYPYPLPDATGPHPDQTTPPPAPTPAAPEEFLLTMTLVMGLGVTAYLIHILLEGVHALFVCQSNNRLDTQDTKPLTRETGVEG